MFLAGLKLPNFNCGSGVMSGSRGWTLAGRLIFRLPHLSAVAAFAFACVMLVGAVRANDPCKTVGATTTCSGNQSAGIAFNPNNATTSLWVQSLTVPQPASTCCAKCPVREPGVYGVAHAE